MKLVLQRVQSSSVSVEGKKISTIGRGLLAFVGIEANDNEAVFRKAIDKIKKLRIFEDAQGRMNQSIEDIHGEILWISQFTLLADLSQGNRPGFKNAGDPALARAAFEDLSVLAKTNWPKSRFGQFGANMHIELINDGPATFVLDIRG